ncbi:MAG: Uma2 family endonuclease [Microcystis aeruginosa LG13-12]|nr:Uma2 family endonuclease [Microcystis aeruginosa LG13-12]
MTIATDKSTYSFAEYLELEETAAYKNEYQDGEIVPMTGGTTDHNKIAGNFYFITNPRLIVEVLSKSTQNYDQGDKFLYYRSLPEFQEYILISQSRPYIMQYNKTQENKWLLTEYEGENASLSLTSVNFDLSFQEIYEGVTFNIINKPLA